ncbi:MAG TPA: DUF559 domain-containing protein [Candidatus Sulfopaludibacter sp.]|nr:DUF559 domain-containing protein [Candidatus Sulfopaludibacter sp.]
MKPPARISGRPASDGEAAFAHYLRILAPELPEPEREHRFLTGRDWRVDFAWPKHKAAVEIEGWSHRSSRYDADLDKYNVLALNGWRLLRFTNSQVLSDPAAVIEMVRWLLQPTASENSL